MTKKNDKPNIFNYATKELSQDAVICWLLDWAGRQDVQDKEDKALRDCGRRFVEALLDEHGDSLKGDIEKIEILQQDHGIDVLARINYHNDRQQVLLIEDKTDTGVHGTQLEDYYKAVVGGKTGLGKVGEKTLYPIFFKTGNQSRAQDDMIEKKRVETGKEYKYKVFNRAEFLEVLKSYEGSNSVLLDFRAYLQEWEDDTNSFKDWKEGESKKWSKYAWQGFFRCLEEEFINCMKWDWWGYVSNPAGGFWGFSWDVNGIETGEAKLYLLLEIVPGEPDKQKLCFKVKVDNKENRSVTRNKWHKWCMAAVAEVAGIEASKPERFGTGKHMTVAQWSDKKEKGDWLAFDADGTLDLDKTAANLKKAEAVLAKAIEMEKRQGDETQS